MNHGLPPGSVSPQEELGFGYKEEVRMTLGRHPQCLPNHQAVFRLNREDAKAKEQEVDTQVPLQSTPQPVSRKHLSPRGSFCELSRCLVKRLLNCLCLPPPVSHRPKGCPWGREGSDPRYPFAKSLREVMRLNRFVFEKGFEALARKVPQKCKSLQFIACWMARELNCFKLEFQGPVAGVWDSPNGFLKALSSV